MDGNPLPCRELPYSLVSDSGTHMGQHGSPRTAFAVPVPSRTLETAIVDGTVLLIIDAARDRSRDGSPIRQPLFSRFKEGLHTVSSLEGGRMDSTGSSGKKWCVCMPMLAMTEKRIHCFGRCCASCASCAASGEEWGNMADSQTIRGRFHAQYLPNLVR